MNHHHHRRLYSTSPSASYRPSTSTWYTLRVAALAFAVGFALEAAMSYTTYFDQLRVAEGKRRIARKQEQEEQAK